MNLISEIPSTEPDDLYYLYQNHLAQGSQLVVGNSYTFPIESKTNVEGSPISPYQDPIRSINPGDVVELHYDHNHSGVKMIIVGGETLWLSTQELRNIIATRILKPEKN